MRDYLSLCLSSILLMLICSCQSSKMKTEQLLVDSLEFQSIIDGDTAHLYHLQNKQGMRAQFTNFGARIVSLIVPDAQGNAYDVVLGFNKGSDYNNVEEPYFGTIVGPFGNRIAKGKMLIDGQQYKMPTNNGPNTLHGGYKGVHFAFWKVKKHSASAITFAYVLPHLNEGFPGDIRMEVTYTLSDSNALSIEYTGLSDRKTHLNLTNHAYFNLNAEGTILNHELQLFADTYTPVDRTLIPTGKFAAVDQTAFDFSKLKTIGRDIDQQDEQLAYGQGYDHNFVLNKNEKLALAAVVKGDKSGIVMQIYTEEPGMQFYSGNFMAEKVQFKNGQRDRLRTGFCLEPQHFPDSPNQTHFPSTLYQANEIYRTKSVYKFSY